MSGTATPPRGEPSQSRTWLYIIIVVFAAVVLPAILLISSGRPILILGGYLGSTFLLQAAFSPEEAGKEKSGRYWPSEPPNRFAVAGSSYPYNNDSAIKARTGVTT